jgi:hypothetical protein
LSNFLNHSYLFKLFTEDVTEESSKMLLSEIASKYSLIRVRLCNSQTLIA